VRLAIEPQEEKKKKERFNTEDTEKTRTVKKQKARPGGVKSTQGMTAMASISIWASSEKRAATPMTVEAGDVPCWRSWCGVREGREVFV